MEFASKKYEMEFGGVALIVAKSLLQKFIVPKDLVGDIR